jgi:hypothetical protein
MKNEIWCTRPLPLITSTFSSRIRPIWLVSHTGVACRCTSGTLQIALLLTLAYFAGVLSGCCWSVHYFFAKNVPPVVPFRQEARGLFRRGGNIIYSDSERLSSESDGIKFESGWKHIHVYFGNNRHLVDASEIPSNYYFNTSSDLHQGNSVSGTATQGNLQKQRRKWFSQWRQDYIVATLFRGMRNGYFVDLAANDAIRISNTYALETNYNWTGLCIEPQARYWPSLAYRQQCQVVGAVIGGSNFNASHQEVLFRFPNRAGPQGGIVGVSNRKKLSYPVSHFNEDQRRYSLSLAAILDTFQAPTTIDYLSLDVEGSEDSILNDFPFNRYRFKVLTIENPSPSLCNLLQKNQYKCIKHLTKNGHETLWVHTNIQRSLDILAVSSIDTESYQYYEK